MQLILSAKKRYGSSLTAVRTAELRLYSRLLTQVIVTYQQNFVISTFRNKNVSFVYSLCGPQVFQFQFIAKVAQGGEEEKNILGATLKV
jgi:hypothetical protein